MVFHNISGMKIAAFLLMVFLILIYASSKALMTHIWPDEYSPSIVETIMVSASMLFFGLLAWFYQRVGGAILLLYGLLSLVTTILVVDVNSYWGIKLITLMWSFPLLISGVLFIINDFREKGKKSTGGRFITSE